ncbi:MAG: glycerol-3-phosphate dehydrogenase [Pseudomonadota bacterium]
MYPHTEYDLAIVGGGINGAGIAADAAGRGLRVFLCEQADFASATSSASSKLVHGGLRYLEHYEFRLVREALAEREVLLRMAPHLVHPQRFVMPHAPHLRPAWMIRAGLFLYDHLGKRVTLPGSRRLDIGDEPQLRAALRDEFRTGFEYSDCTVDDARLVIANLLAAHEHGATVVNYTRCERAVVVDGGWQLQLTDAAGSHTVRARALVNAAGPWAQQFLEQRAQQKSPYHVRLVQGSHIVVPRLHDDPRALIVQNEDGRVVFILPWLDFTVIGTTDREYTGDPAQVAITPSETQYLLDVANRHLKCTLATADILAAWSGVRPLCDDESGDPSAVTRDYTLSLATDAGAPLLTVFGGKLTTYRRLALSALARLLPLLPATVTTGEPWTHRKPLPGGELQGRTPEQLARALVAEFPWLPLPLATRWARAYGSRCRELIGPSRSLADLGRHFGHDLYAREADFLRRTEWARTADDLLWRRSKLGMYLDTQARVALAEYLEGRGSRHDHRPAA